jgi:adenine-specific DNA-methyltransferase
MSQHKVKTRGVVFTPANIAKFMASYIDNSRKRNILEPSCGMGNFIEHINPVHNITCIDIEKEYIKHCSAKFKHTKCILKNFIHYKTNDKFDYIIGNPPYIKIQNIAPDDLMVMRREYPEFMQGNTNIYIYFIIKCFDLLSDDGKLIFIVPNTWLYSKSFSKLKDFIFKNQWMELLIDFKHQQVFDNVSTYTSIIILTKRPNKFYYYSESLTQKFIKKSYENKKITSTLLSIISPKIGLMTLKDAVFIIKKFKIANGNVYFTKNNTDYVIERDACKTILKVSKNMVYLVVYPYDSNAKVMDNFEKMYPKAYNYLLEYKRDLDNRDKGKKPYKYWYCYGRTQSLKVVKGKRLFISTIVKNIKDFLIEKDVDLYYSGLCITPIHKSTSISSMKLKLMSKEKQILQRSNHKSHNWFGLSVGSFMI